MSDDLFVQQCWLLRDGDTFLPDPKRNRPRLIKRGPLEVYMGGMYVSGSERGLDHICDDVGFNSLPSLQGEGTREWAVYWYEVFQSTRMKRVGWEGKSGNDGGRQGLAIRGRTDLAYALVPVSAPASTSIGWRAVRPVV